MIKSEIVSRKSEGSRFWFWVGPATFSLFDGIVTLLGQPPVYWNDGYQVVQEYNPLGAYLLRIGPVTFMLALLIWIGINIALISYVPRVVARWWSLMLLVGHSVGVATWLFQLETIGIALMLVALLVMRLFAIPMWDNPGGSAQTDEN